MWLRSHFFYALLHMSKKSSTFAAEIKIYKIMKKLFYLLAVASMLISCAYDPTTDEWTGEVRSIFRVVKQSQFTIKCYNSSTNAKSYVWDFGDGETSTDEEPTHTYKKPGAYRITLLAKRGKQKDESYYDLVINVPNACYVTGITYNKVQYDNKYYYCQLYDGSLFGSVFKTSYTMLSNSICPKQINFSPKVDIDYKNHDTYTLYAYWANNSSGSGETQTMKQKFTKSKLQSYPSTITLTNDPGNTQIVLQLEWK